MKISYRLSSGLVILTALLNGAVSAISGPPPAACNAVPEMSMPVRISGYIAFPLLVVLLLQGMRDRAVPRWLAVIALVALVIAMQFQFRYGAACQSILEIVASALWVLALAVMCLHQILQRPAEPAHKTV